MTKDNTTWVNGYEAGFQAGKDEISSNYDKWKRACEARGISGQILSIADLAVRQVIYGNETGTRNDETQTTEKETT